MNQNKIKVMIIRDMEIVRRWGFLSFFSVITITVQAQDYDSLPSRNKKFLEQSPFTRNLFVPVVAIEAWAIYTNEKSNAEIPNSNRTDILFRRFRFGGHGSPYSWFTYDFQFQMDRLGADPYSSISGKYNNIGIWNAYITIRLLKKSELLYLHAGYFWASISREFSTSAWSQGAFDRSEANWYLRNFITGKGNGIESGIAICGLKNFDRLGISYRFGSFEPQSYNSNQFESRVYIGHILFSFGDHELSTYKYRLPGNHWRRRNGITLGLGVSTQSNGIVVNSTKLVADSLTGEIVTKTIETYFNQSYSYGADILIDYRGLRIDGEYFILARDNAVLEGFKGTQKHIRLSYNFKISNMFIEPIFSLNSYNGIGNKNLFNYIGAEYSMDFGMNWYIKKDKLKLALHFIMHDGNVRLTRCNYMGIAFQFKL